MGMQFSAFTKGRLQFLIDVGLRLSAPAVQFLTRSEVEARGARVVAIERTPTRLLGLDRLEVLLRVGSSVNWNIEAPRVAEAVSLMPLIAHAPDKLDGRALADRLKFLCRTYSIPAMAKGWLLRWYENLRTDSAVSHTVRATTDSLLWFCAERIAVLDDRFPGLVGTRLNTPVPPPPIFVAA